MKLCLHCNNEIDKSKYSYNKLKYCSHNCYASSIRGISKDMSYATAAAARKRKGCLQRTKENAPYWFWSKTVTRDNGCIEWTGSKAHGYGVVYRFNGQKDCKAHRISFWLHNDYWAENYVLHSCDNKSCVNPLHLREGTHLDNVQDAIDRKRYKYGDQSPSAKLNSKVINEIRTSAEQNKILAKKYGVHPTTIGRVKKWEIWTNL